MRADRPIRVGIDGFNLAMRQGTGVATYARSLAEACTELGRPLDLVYGLSVPPTATAEQRETLFFAALAHGLSNGEPPLRRTALQQVRRLFLRRKIRTLTEIPVSGRVIRKGIAGMVPSCDRLFTYSRLFHVVARYLRRFGTLMPVRVPCPPDIMHWTYPVPVRLVGSRNVYTIHDLVPLRLPYLSLEDKRYHERLLGACLSEGAHVLTVSEASRTDILQYLRTGADKVTNCYQALPTRRGKERSSEELARNLHGIFNLKPDGYFLFAGAVEPKKNLGRLIEAYLSSGLDTPLVLAGPDGWCAEEELRLLDGSGGMAARAEGRIRRLGYLPADHLEQLVQGARAVAFPSLYEGFGLPVLEAMAAGRPVIAGSEGALPEIVSGAAILVDPYDVDAIGRALIEIDSDAALRRELSLAGARRAEDFTMTLYRARIDAFHHRLMAAANASGAMAASPKIQTSLTGELM